MVEVVVKVEGVSSQRERRERMGYMLRRMYWIKYDRFKRAFIWEDLFIYNEPLYMAM
jgi:hypothetical protein